METRGITEKSGKTTSKFRIIRDEQYIEETGALLYCFILTQSEKVVLQKKLAMVVELTMA